MNGVIRIGLVGCGGFARHHLSRLVGDARFQVAALCDPDPAQIELSRVKYPSLAKVAAFTQDSEMLAAGGLDAVLVCSPHTCHAGQVERAFGSGLHVLVEKPLATTVADCLRCIEARDKSGRLGAISYQRHGQGPFQFIREHALGGDWGRLLAVNSHLGQEWLRLTRGSWRQSKALSGGGQINDSGSHMIDVLLWATGLRAKRVSAFMDNRGTEVDIDSVVSIQFEGGVYGSLTIVGDAVVWHERHALWFERAAVFLEDDKVTVIDEHQRRMVVDSWPPAVHPLDNFAEAVLAGAQVLAPFECGLETIRLTEAAWNSAGAGGQPVSV